MTNVLITGATGFVGKSLALKMCHSKQFRVSTLSRTTTKIDNVNEFIRVSISNESNLTDVLENVDVVIHCIAQLPARAFKFDFFSDIKKLKSVNIDLACSLYKQASKMGVKRFIFISTIGVHGNKSKNKITEKSVFSPQNLYSSSKLEAEQKLLELSKASQTEVVIIRPPLVYGRGAGGFFKTIERLISAHFPFPISALDNTRSMISINNLCEFIVLCTTHPELGNEVFVVSDSDSYPLNTVLETIASAKDIKMKSIRVPRKITRFLLKLFLPQKLNDKLLGSLVIDDTYAKNKLRWQPSTSLKDELKGCFRDVEL